MRSQFVDEFNHDAEAPGYDQDVLNEHHPIRAGYSDLLDWVATEAQAEATCSIRDLGTGTGNLAQRLSSFKQLVCVDISREMLRIARAKLFALPNVHYVEADILEYFESPRSPCHIVASTYTVHHLTEPEKAQLFRAVAAVLKSDGVAVFGDLMFENDCHRHRYLAQLRRSAQLELADEIEDELFWNVERAVDELKALGFLVSVRHFSELSWGISTRKTVCSSYAI